MGVIPWYLPIPKNPTRPRNFGFPAQRGFVVGKVKSSGESEPRGGFDWGFQGEKVLLETPTLPGVVILVSGRGNQQKTPLCQWYNLRGVEEFFKPYRMPLWWQVPSASYLCVVPPNPSILWLFRWKNNTPFTINKNGSPFATPNDPRFSPRQSQRGSLEWTSNLIPRNCGDFLHKNITSEYIYICSWNK